MATLSPGFADFLPGWVATQRWYRGKGGSARPALRLLASLRWEDPLGEVGLEDHIVVDESGPEPVVYQIPLSYRAEAVDFLADALVATAEHSELGTRYIYDATHDPVFAQTLLQHMWAEHDVPSARARRVAAEGEAPALRTATVLSGEQSNTSVIIEAHGGSDPVIMKIFRVLQAGENPEVSVAAAIAPTGNRSIPTPIGYVEGRWQDEDGEEVRGHLAFAQEFLPGTEDAWRRALEAARSEEDFAGRARDLGATTASVHAALREAFEPVPADEDSRTTLVDQMRARAAAAFAEVPELEAYSADIDAIYDELERLELPALQRIHGDYHLGQVLEAPGRGWVMLDFEGEPLRPLAERSAPDLALRDVAGMLRSFDYAAATVGTEGGGERDAWARAARAAFLEGYTTASGEDLDASDSRRVLDALELDKALYEVAYEARNRPDWVPIPVGAVHRLISAHRDSAGSLAASASAAPGRHRAPDSDMHRAPDSDLADGDALAESDTLTDSDTLADLDPAVHGPSLRDPESAVSAQSGPEPADDVAAEAREHDAAPSGKDPSSGSSHEPAHRDASALAGGALAGGALAAGGPSGAGDLASGHTDTGEAAGAEPTAEAGQVGDADDAAPRSYPPASGVAPHAPIPPPRVMLTALEQGPGSRTTEVEEPRTTGRAQPEPSTDLEPRDYPAASGLAPGAGSDPVEGRDRAWADATYSPAVVTGRVHRGVDAADGPAGEGDGDQPVSVAPVRRVKLAAPATPAAPHTRPLDLDEATDVVYGLHRNPHTILGAHEHQGHVTIRTVQPDADAVTVLLPEGSEVPMSAETGGIWVAVLARPDVPVYRLRVEELGRTRILDEAYRYGPTLGDIDLHLFGEGRHEELWRVLGSHVRTVHDEMGEVTGTHFAVWAPNALAVHVIGDFNGWDGARHALRVHEDVGVWEIFVPGVGAGAHYKYDITGPDGTRRAKADPMARASEVPPFNNSVVTVSSHRWSEGDAEWMDRRNRTDPHHGPMSIYEVHLASWRPGLKYEQLADELVAYVQEMGFTHVEFMPVMQHPYGPSWGYHVTGYYAVDARLGHEDGLRYLIDRLHQIGVGVILDWVPGHFATDPWALARFDGTPIYEHPDPRKGWHPEWGSYIFDFGRPQVRNFLVANATYWLEEFHADGLRVDGVASMLYLDYSREAGQWVPNRYGGRENLEAVALLQETNATAYRRSPGVVLIAEESTSWPGVTAPVDEGGLGFGFKWNMGWMHDTLDYLGQSPYARAHHHHTMTFSLIYAFGEKYILPISHDEVVHGKGSLVRKMSGNAWQKFATTRAFLAYQWSHPGKQLLFMGSEFAQAREWADGGSLEWELLDQPHHAGVRRLVQDLNRLYHELPSLWQIDHHEDGFTWLDANDAGRNTYSYLRWGNEGEDGLRPVVAVVVNFSGMTQEQVHVGLPYGGRWREVLNTDAETYGGSGVGNMGAVQAYDVEHQRQPFSALVTVPPLGAVWLVPDPVPDEEAVADETAVDETAGDDAAVDEAELEQTELEEAAGTPAPPVDPTRIDQLAESETADLEVTEVEDAEFEELKNPDPGQVSEVTSLAAVEDGTDLTAETAPTELADTGAAGGLDREQAGAADGDLDARPASDEVTRDDRTLDGDDTRADTDPDGSARP